MEIGVSSSCFYPALVEDSFRQAAQLGIKTAEIFVNSYCELSGSALRELKAIKDFYSINVRSVHPFTSAFETVMFFSNYERRLTDSIEFYKNYFNAANELGAQMIVMHGGKTALPISPEEYASDFSRLMESARESGLYIAHENVREHHCENPAFMKKVADLVGDDFRMVLDIKQCRRSHVSEYDFIRLLGGKIAQVHLSDNGGKGQDCLAPGKGNYDFKKLFSALNDAGYDKSAVIELYSNDFDGSDDIKRSLTYLEKV